MSREVTSQSLQAQISALEQKLEETERQQLACDASENDGGGIHQTSTSQTPAERLAQLQRTADDLVLAQQVAEWTRRFEEEESTEELLNEKSDQEELFRECRHAWALGGILLRHVSQASTTTRTVIELYEHEYVALFTYLRTNLIVALQKSLRGANYPDPSSCLGMKEALGQKPTRPRYLQDLVTACHWLVQLPIQCQEITQLLRARSSTFASPVLPASPFDDVVTELCRPFVERVRFHFLEKDESRPQSSRIDRLPEWLFGYLRKQIFSKGPWDVITALSCTVPPSLWMTRDVKTAADTTAQAQVTTLAPLPLHVINEVIRLIQWVLGERNFFRHPKIAGPDSNPLFLCDAVGQLLLLDDFFQEQLPPVQHRSVISLMDVFVAGDDDLLQWWLKREREAVFAALFRDLTVPAPLVYRVSPRAELFCALIKSIRTKASLFTFSGPYWNAVAAPLCMQFVDAVHESAIDLQRRVSSRDRASMANLETVLDEWIKLLNGTHMATMTLLSPQDIPSRGDEGLEVSQQVGRFGKSLENLETVLLEEFAGVLFERKIMEQAKFAGYLMRCPSLLMQECNVNDMDTSSRHGAPSLDLRDSIHILKRILLVCEGYDDKQFQNEQYSTYADEFDAHELADFAPSLLRNRILSLVGDKFLEIALNWNGMTPELLYTGSTLFAQDVEAVFGVTDRLPPDVLRLLDVAKIMSMDNTTLAGIGNALCGLAGQPGPLTEDVFASDGRLYEEAMSMIQAKGFVWLTLDDVLLILNRRNDM